jgi:hypothetical protein
MSSIRTVEYTIFALVVLYIIYKVTTIHSTPQPPPDLTAGGTLAQLNTLPNYPVDVYPAVNVADGSTTVSVFIIQSNALYPIPGNFTFLNKWSFLRFDPTKVVLDSDFGNGINDTAYAIQGSGCYNQVVGNVPIQSGDRVIFSVLSTSVTDIGTGEEAVGVAEFTSSLDFLGNGNSVAFYGDGSVYNNENFVVDGLTPFFGAPGHILDVAVDRVDNKIWYRIDGGAWNG